MKKKTKGEPDAPEKTYQRPDHEDIEDLERRFAARHAAESPPPVVGVQPITADQIPEAGR